MKWQRQFLLFGKIWAEASRGFMREQQSGHIIQLSSAMGLATLPTSYFEGKKTQEIGLPTVSYMAEKLHVSTRYLTDLLKQETGKTALELIHLFLIAEAKNLLTEGQMNISEISYALGFDNPTYFSRLFKKEVGLTPNKFRDNLLN